TLHKFTLEERESEEFMTGVQQASMAANGEKMLVQNGSRWRVVGTEQPPGNGGETLNLTLRMQLDRQAEGQQMFEEAWRYERDYFYDPILRGRDLNEVRARYEPLVPHVRHRTDLSYLLDQINGEL